jgi:hypothetical protein
MSGLLLVVTPTISLSSMELVETMALEELLSGKLVEKQKWILKVQI